MRDTLRLAAVLTMLPISLVGSTASGSPPPQQEGPKIYISADFEGVTGVVTGEQLGPDGFEYGRFREFMTGEVLAAIEGARAAGAGEILVSDSHGNGHSLGVAGGTVGVRLSAPGGQLPAASSGCGRRDRAGHHRSILPGPRPSGDACVAAVDRRWHGGGLRHAALGCFLVGPLHSDRRDP